MTVSENLPAAQRKKPRLFIRTLVPPGPIILYVTGLSDTNTWVMGLNSGGVDTSQNPTNTGRIN